MRRENERRFYERFDIKLSIRYSEAIHGYDFLGKNMNFGTSVNLSAGGICFNVKEDIEVGRLLRIIFILPNTFGMGAERNSSENKNNMENMDSEPVLKMKYFVGVGKVIRTCEEKDNTNNISVKFVNIEHEVSQDLNFYLEQWPGRTEQSLAG